MTRSTRGKTNQLPDNTPSLSELLQDTNFSDSDSYGDVDPNTLQRLVYTVTGIGAMATFWYDSVNGRLCLSVRSGNDKRSYQWETTEQFQMGAEAIISKLTPALRAKLAPPPTPPTPPDKAETKDK